MRHLLLVGAGPGNLWLLKRLGRSRPADLNISLVTPSLQALYPRLLAGWIGGHHVLEDCLLPVQALVQACQARLLVGPCRALRADQRELLLADGQLLAFDWLGLDTEAHMGRARLDIQMPGARQHALFAHPLNQFVSLWPRLASLAAERAIHVVVVGEAAAALELVLAAAQALRVPHGSRISWVTTGEPGAMLPGAARRHVVDRLRSLQVTVLRAGCVGIGASEVMLDNGARLVCDAPVLAGPCGTPEWLAQSELELDAGGRVLVDGQARSRSHGHVWAVNAAASEHDAGGPGVAAYPERSGPFLLRNLRAALRENPGRAATTRAAGSPGFGMLDCGRREAVAVWRGLSAGGRPLGWIKRALDRRFMKSLA